MAAIDYRTGKAISGWAAVLQAVHILFITGIGSRVMRRSYGSRIPRLLGEPLITPTVLKFVAAIMTAIELWEPRLRVVRATIVKAENSPESVREGRLAGLSLAAEYRPRGHLGDPTPETAARRIYIGFGQSGTEISG